MVRLLPLAASGRLASAGGQAGAVAFIGAGARVSGSTHHFDVKLRTRRSAWKSASSRPIRGRGTPTVSSLEDPAVRSDDDDRLGEEHRLASRPRN